MWKTIAYTNFNGGSPNGAVTQFGEKDFEVTIWPWDLSADPYEANAEVYQFDNLADALAKYNEYFGG